MAIMQAEASVRRIDPETSAESSHTADALLREAVGVFRDYEKFQSALDDLQSSGFGRTDLSTVASKQAVERILGRFYTTTEEIEDNPEVPRSIFISKASLGDAEGVLIGGSVYLFAVTVAAVLAAMGFDNLSIILGVLVAGAVGGLIGYLIARYLDRRYSERFTRQMQQGGLVLWVNLKSPEQEARAVDILTRYGADHVHVHTLPVHYYPIDSELELDPDTIRRPHPTAWWNP
jgi:hypothetical protein